MIICAHWLAGGREFSIIALIFDFFFFSNPPGSAMVFLFRYDTIIVKRTHNNRALTTGM
jgi:hypothetical protein